MGAGTEKEKNLKLGRDIRKLFGELTQKGPITRCQMNAK